jgi:hypothetical protein
MGPGPIYFQEVAKTLDHAIGPDWFFKVSITMFIIFISLLIIFVTEE